MDMRKILFLLPSRALSGGVLVVRHHARLLAEKGYEVTVAYLHACDLDDDDIMPVIKPVREILHAELCDDDTFDVAVATWWETAYYLAEVRSKSYFYFVQAFEDRLYPADSVWPLLVQRTLQAGFHFITVNTGLQRYLQTMFNQTSVVVPPGISMEDYDCQPAIERKNNQLRVLVEGSPEALYKRVGLAFEALALVSNIETVYVSPEGNAKNDWHVDYFFERVPPGRMPAIHKSCDLILKLSTDETFSMPVLESFAAGATAVTAQFYGGSDFIVDGENALIVPVDDVSAVVKALQKLQTDRQFLQGLRANAEKTAQNYSWCRQSSKFEEALRCGFMSSGQKVHPLQGCLQSFQAAHAMRLELTQAKLDNDHLRDAHAHLSQILGRAQAELSEAGNEAARLRASRSYRVGNSIARAYRKIKPARADR